ncbi:MAG: efflux RND transporter permease subunit [Phycisphaerales bacterium]|nr:efflux RND transporter permease subunit [Phycisphaerales bacterium]
MDIIRASIEKPVAVVVGVLLILLFGVLALNTIPIQLTPNVDSTVVTISTFWEGASPQEVEQDIIEKQEDKLKGLSGLRKMTSQSRESNGQITLEFEVGTDKDAALREASDKLREVSSYPEGVDEPVIEASDPMNRDYIAWIIFETDDADFNIRTLQDFAEDNIKTAFERVPGMSTVNVLGGLEREVQVRTDPVRLAQHALTYGDLFDALRRENVDLSAGSMEEGKASITLRTVGRYRTVEDVEQTVITRDAGGPIYVRDVADVVMTYKKPSSFVHSKGNVVIAINAQREVGSNVIEVMDGLQQSIAQLNQPGGLLEVQSRKLGLSQPLQLRQVYDQTVYIDQAIGLVTSNIYIGGAIAVITLLLFLRSVRSVGIIALAIPISVIGTFVAMVAMGRNLNVISLAGLAFAVGMVVDNSIVVLENIYRHIEMGATPRQAAYRAPREVWGAVLASTLTTIVVFIPVLFIKEDAGQLFRDIVLAICSAVALSLVVSITVVPCAAAIWLSLGSGMAKRRNTASNKPAADEPRGISGALGRLVYALCGSIIARVAIVIFFAVGSIWGSIALMPPTDYLPKGNRNLVFGMLVPPPGYNLDKQAELGARVEAEIRPFWEAGELKGDPQAYEKALEQLPPIPTFSWATGQPGPPVRPPSLQNYFFVAFNGFMFHGGVSDDGKRVVDVATLFNHATRAENLPGVTGFAFQAPLFRLSGSSGSSIDVEFSGEDIDQVNAAAGAAFNLFNQEFGYGKVQSQPGNFQIAAPQVNVIVDRLRAAELGLSTRDVGLAVRALGEGANIGEFRIGGESIDLKVLDGDAIEDGRWARRDISALSDTPIATATGQNVPLASVARLVRTTAPQQINHVERQRAVSLEVTPDKDIPLGEAMDKITAIVEDLRQQGQIPETVNTDLAGSADKLTSVRKALLGDGTLIGLLSSRFFLALLINYLLMCVLFESFLYPLVILFSVPLATFGGFLGLRLVHNWTAGDPYMPTQNLDILTMLGFVMLLGTVVNNAILIVYQALNFMNGYGESEQDVVEKLSPRKAIAESVRTRLRPIMMTAMTTVGGTVPLVVMPGSGSELYRGLGSVMLGGLIMSTLFTLVLVPMLFSLVIDARLWLTNWLAAAGGSWGRPTLHVAAPQPHHAAAPRNESDEDESTPARQAEPQPVAK